MVAPPLLERAALPLDSLRSTLYRWALAFPPLAWFIPERDRRVALTATLHALIAFSIVVAAPTLLLAVGPVLLGVMHVVADLRFLVLRRGLARAWLGAILVACAALIALRAAQEAGMDALMGARAEHALVVIWMGAALAVGAVHSGRPGRALLGAPVVVALAAVSQLDPWGTRIAFVHLHNLVAVVLWLFLFRGRVRAVLVPLALIAALTSLLLSGQTYFWTEKLGTVDLLGLHVLAAADWLAPGLPLPAAAGLTLSFTFLQSVHYSTWLLVVPQEDLRGQGTATWRMAMRSMTRELGRVGVWIMLATVAAVPIAACFDLHRSRNLYLSLAMFHGYLELALGAYFFARGGLTPLKP
ncbi:MAG: hypothetical protein HYZ29_27800 [Myxococcales bacterium]|nr:hypothetical protein [Myxococcales bacterium]